MTNHEFSALLNKFCSAAEAGDGEAFSQCFCQDAIYHDYIYGDHVGRAEIAHMMGGQFHRDCTDYRWTMLDPVCNGDLGYAWSLSAFTSTLPNFAGKKVVIDGMSRFELKDGLIADYRESVNGGVAMVQLGVPAAKVEKVLKRWSVNLQDRADVIDYLAQR